MPIAENANIHRTSLLLRLALALLSAAVLVWLLIGVRDSILLARGKHETARNGVPGNSARATRDYKDARLLSPDTEPDLQRALLDNYLGQRRAAVALLRSVLRVEPQNSRDWTALFAIVNGHNDAIAEQAATEIRRLDPLVGRGG